jgi:hypothetical protein
MLFAQSTNRRMCCWPPPHLNIKGCKKHCCIHWWNVLWYGPLKHKIIACAFDHILILTSKDSDVRSKIAAMIWWMLPSIMSFWQTTNHYAGPWMQSHLNIKDSKWYWRNKPMIWWVKKANVLAWSSHKLTSIACDPPPFNITGCKSTVLLIWWLETGI